jgi:hypothetical protein
MPRPSDMFEAKLVDENNWTEEYCLERLMDAALP